MSKQVIRRARTTIKQKKLFAIFIGYKQLAEKEYDSFKEALEGFLPLVEEFMENGGTPTTLSSCFIRMDKCISLDFYDIKELGYEFRLIDEETHEFIKNTPLLTERQHAIIIDRFRVSKSGAIRYFKSNPV